MSSDAAIYQEALQGFREAVPNRSVNVQLLTNRLEERADQLRSIRSVVEPNIVFVIGTPALQAVSGKITHIPVVHAIVFNPLSSAISAAKNVTGISMIPSADQTVALIKELSPKIRRIGVMYDPTTSDALFRQAQAALQREKMQLVARRVQSPADIAGALKSFEKEIDLLWLWADERFLADEIVQRILLFSIERKIPVLGLSERHTQMGALLSLAYGSPRDMGKQAGELVNGLLSKTNVTPGSLIVPRRLKLTVNLKAARQLGIEVPDSMIQRADNAIKAPVYKEGDWWVFRIKTLYPDGRAEIEDHRVIFKNGTFETKDSSFLRGEDLQQRASFLPFASVYIEDPRAKFLDFPLLAGKKWTFWYGRHFYLVRRGSTTYATAEAEVIGRAPHPIETPAGRFEAIEIQRVDHLSGPVHLTYFYSPQTKSVIWLRAGPTWISGRRFELELIAYGTAGTERKATQ